MARVTIEDALGQCESRYELAVLLSYRAHMIASSSRSVVNNDNKFAVLALREVEAGKVNIPDLRDTVIRKYAEELQGNITNNTFLLDDTSVDNSVSFAVPESTVEHTVNLSDKGSGIDLGVEKDFFK